MMRSNVGSRAIPENRRWRTFLASSSLLLVIAVAMITLLLGVVLGRLGVYLEAAVIGAVITAIVLILRQDELAVMIVIAVHLYVDWYWGLDVVAQLLVVTLLAIFFLGRSPTRPWVEPRALWLWALFIVLAILPATHGISPLDTLNYYINIIFGSFTIFWIGMLIARNSA